MKRYFCLLLLVSLAISQAAYTQPSSSAKQLKDGKYISKTAMVDVAVTVENGEITEIEILEHRGGGQEYADMIEPLIGKIIEEQSTQVDAVTGATVSSDALKKAVTNAVEQAGK